MMDEIISEDTMNENNSKFEDSKIDNINFSVFREYIGNPSAFIYLFYNKLSGGNIESYFSKNLIEVVLEIDGIITHINFVDMISDMENGLNRVKNSLKITNKDVCIIGIGGDGSLSTLVNYFLNIIPESINRLVFAVLPFGTGNDWARNFGWISYGNIKFMKDDFLPLIDLSRGIFTSNVVDFDIWSIEVELYNNNNSCFLKVDPIRQELQRINIDNNNEKLLNLKKRCLNYFSFGEESRVGITFETYRKKNVLLNRALYGLAGSMFTVNLSKQQNNTPLSHSTKGIYIIDEDKKYNNDDNLDIILDCGMCTKGTKHNYKDNEICPTLSRSVSLVFLNIETFGGGVQLWKNSKNLGPSIIKNTPNINIGEVVGTISSFLVNPINIDLKEDKEENNKCDNNNNDNNKERMNIELDKDNTTESELKNSLIDGDIEDILNIIPCSNDKRLEIMSFSGILDFSSIFLPYMSAAKRVGQFVPFENQFSSKAQACNNEKVEYFNDNNGISNKGKSLKLVFNHISNQLSDDELIEIYFQIDGEYYLAKEPKHCIIKYDQTIRVLKCIIPYSPFNK